jgi:hypothetical protein
VEPQAGVHIKVRVQVPAQAAHHIPDRAAAQVVHHIPDRAAAQAPGLQAIAVVRDLPAAVPAAGATALAADLQEATVDLPEADLLLLQEVAAQEGNSLKHSYLKS